ncbi:MAG: hypothetical protein ABWY58_09960 [Aeromicrobium sp.]
MRPPASALLLFAGLSAVSLAIALARIGRGGANIVMLGPFPSGKVQVVLFALGACAIGLSFLVFATAAAFRCAHRWLGLFLSLLVTVAWLASLPLWALVCVVGSLEYEDSPETHRFETTDGKYLLATQPQYDPSQVSLTLYRKDGLVYSRVTSRWAATSAAIAPADVGRGDFSVVRSGDRAWIAFDATRLEIPGP